MRLLIYVGPAPSREQVIAYAAPLIERVATSVTLLTGGGEERRALLDEAVSQLPDTAPITLQALPGDTHQAILAASAAQVYDLVIFGRLNRPLGRLLARSRSKQIAQRLQPSVLRVQGQATPIRRILVASGGDYHTFEDAGVAAQLAGPLGAEVTIIHIVSQQSLIFEGFGERRISVQDFLASAAPEANTLRSAATLLRQRTIAVQIKGRAGPVLDELLDELRHGRYDLLVIGAHRISSPLDRILLDDISGELLDLSPIPVIVVKGHQL